MNTTETVTDIQTDQAEAFLRWLLANPHADIYAVRTEYYNLDKADQARITTAFKTIEPLRK